MMKVETNLSGVLDRLKRRPRDVRAAIELTLAPEAWKDALQREAQATLWALAKPGEWQQVPAFLKTMMVFGVAGPGSGGVLGLGSGILGFVSRMNSPLPPTLMIEDFMMARGLQQRALRTGSGPMLYSDFLVQFDALLTEWVATEKRKDKRDWSKSDEEIADWTGHLMLTPDNLLSSHASGPDRVSELEAKRRLLPHIAEFLARRQNEQRLPAETVTLWLTGVLAAWTALVRREWPGKFQGHLEKVRSEL